MKISDYLLLFFLFPILVNSQNLSGVIYDADSKLKDIKVTNISKNIVTYSDDTGHFTIKASVGDTLVFYSLFYQQKKDIVTQGHFENKVVIELKKIMNNLGEVVVNDHSKNKTFHPEAYSNALENKLSNDINKNPHLYGTSSSYGFDFVRLASLIGKLFKKEKVKPEALQPINYKGLDSLFAKDKLLNDKFLVNELQIPVDYKKLFFEYCEAQNMNGTLINEANKMYLIEELFKHSKAFKIFLSDYEQGKIKE